MFEGTEWDLIRSNTDHLTTSNSEQDSSVPEMDTDDLIKEVDSFASNIKLQIEQKDQQLIS